MIIYWNHFFDFLAAFLAVTFLAGFFGVIFLAAFFGAFFVAAFFDEAFFDVDFFAGADAFLAPFFKFKFIFGVSQVKSGSFLPKCPNAADF